MSASKKKGTAVWISDEGGDKVLALSRVLRTSRRDVVDQAVAAFFGDLMAGDRKLKKRLMEELKVAGQPDEEDAAS